MCSGLAAGRFYHDVPGAFFPKSTVGDKAFFYSHKETKGSMPWSYRGVADPAPATNYTQTIGHVYDIVIKPLASSAATICQKLAMIRPILPHVSHATIYITRPYRDLTFPPD
jgi:hypothetical protein